MDKYKITRQIKEQAKALGFIHCGIARAEELTDEAKFLENWLNQHHHGQMRYLEKHFDNRIDPRKLVEGAKSVIVLAANYFTRQKQVNGSPKIAMYALGKDYHVVLKDKLKLLLRFIESKTGKIHARCFVDSAPVLERAWAKRAGVGWIGKNTNLLTKRVGSFYFLCEIICDLELEYDSPVKDYCGTCTKCIDACPTHAIEKPYQLNASKCISYFTIEYREPQLPEDMKGKFENWMFGCDICQEICPINAQAKEHQEPLFLPSEELLSKTAEQWEKLSEQDYHRLFAGTAVKRAKYEALKRNIFFLKNNIA
jgi:epoxyqueuosine reductase